MDRFKNALPNWSKVFFDLPTYRVHGETSYTNHFALSSPPLIMASYKLNTTVYVPKFNKITLFTLSDPPPIGIPWYLKNIVL